MSTSQKHNAWHCLVAGLRRQLDRLEAGPAEDTARFSSGAAAIDRLLPGGGLCHGMFVEWLGDCGLRHPEGTRDCGFTEVICNPQSEIRNSSALSGSGAVTLSLLAAHEACREGGVLVVIDRQQMFYPPAAAAWGVDLGRLIIVHPRDRRDELWAAVQSLRSPAVAAVWAMIDRLDQRAFRRLQLAAHAGRTLGLLLRPAGARGQPSWADVQLGVGTEQGARSTGLLPAPCSLLPASGRLVCVRVLRSRRGRAGSAAMLEIDDVAHVVREVISNNDANPLPVAAQLADSAARPRSARAQ